MISFDDRIARVHQLFGMADNMTSAEMRAVIADMIESFESTISKIKSELASAFEKYSINGVLTRAQMNKYGRLLTMETQMANEIKSLTGKLISGTGKQIRNTFESSYYRAGAIVENGYDLQLNLPMMNSNALNANIQNPLNLIKWDQAEKIWATKYTMDIRNHINDGLNQGLGYSQIANNITKSGILNRNRIARIVQTETHRAQSIARKISMEDSKAAARRLGIAMEEVWYSQLLPTTREAHRELDGKTADKDGVFHVQGMTAEYPGGFGIANQDINCHCTIEQRIPSLDREYKRRLKNLDSTGYTEFKYNDLKDWNKIKTDRLAKLNALDGAKNIDPTTGWIKSSIKIGGKEIPFFENPTYNPPKNSASYFHSSASKDIGTIAKNGLLASESNSGVLWFNTSAIFKEGVQNGYASGHTFIARIPNNFIEQGLLTITEQGVRVLDDLPLEWIKGLLEDF